MSIALSYIFTPHFFRYTKTIGVFLFVLITISSFAQKQTPEELRLQEQQKKARLYQLLDSGVYFMNHGKYDAADQKFIYVLNNIRSVPSDLTFYFGKNSFLHRFCRQSPYVEGPPRNYGSVHWCGKGWQNPY